MPTGVIPLHPANFSAVRDGSAWLVEFHAPWCGHCKRFAPEWERAAQALRDIARLGAVDADRFPQLAAEHDVAAYPAVLSFVGDSGAPRRYEGELSAQGVTAYALAEIRELLSARIGRPVRVKGRRRRQQRKGGDAAAGAEARDTSGGSSPSKKRRRRRRRKRAAPAAAAEPPHSEGVAEPQPAAETAAEPQPAEAAAEPQPAEAAAEPPPAVAVPPEVAAAQITDSAKLQGCMAARLCILAVLPHLADSDAAARSAVLEELRGAAAALAGEGATWAWVPQGEQLELEARLEVFGELPQAVFVWGARRKKSSLHRGPFAAAALADGGRAAVGGKAASTPLAQLPRISSGSVWKGHEWVYPVTVG
eukprot:TRINITY_DN27961_c1_g1_i1.p1 TRINITY_DN27961_c1_g1~~TRINITY_DN27961_c1_g1_i1.p1  ORF type:complete len:410 (+),score=96.64 TRINITY_DN27961_c1_g1_i1:140-1231(+)